MKQKIFPCLLTLALASLGTLPLHADDTAPVISVTSPAYCSDISEDTPIDISAPGMASVTVKCWQQGGRFGSDSIIGTVILDPAGKGFIMFPAHQYPHGPITVTISGTTAGNKTDECYLQLYNKSGVSWNEGMPADLPPGAHGLRLVFADDFTGPLSISSTDSSATYYDHKPPHGTEDFGTIPFTGYQSRNNPFAQVDTYLRIRADAKKNSTGLISSEKNDASGVKVSIPCYFECRFISQNARGTWPSFWLLTDEMTSLNAGKSEKTLPVDELDIIEAWGGNGPGQPNAHDRYQITPHAWNQGAAGHAIETAAYKEMKNPISMNKFGIPSTWYEAMHTYGCRITDTDTIYYCDNIEVGRHKTLPNSKKYPFFFMIDLAIGNGSPIDLSRYNGVADMYVDFVRVYAGAQ